MDELDFLNEIAWNDLEVLLRETGEPSEYGFDCYEEYHDFINFALMPDSTDEQIERDWYARLNPKCPGCLEEDAFDPNLDQVYNQRVSFREDENVEVHDLTYECEEHGTFIRYIEYLTDDPE